MPWLSGWTYRKSHAITGAVGAGTNYQIQITVHYGSGTDNDDDVYMNSNCETDFQDIRFTDDDGVTELDYWIESYVDSDNAVIWVEVADDLGSNQTIYIYYGNASATYPHGDDQTEMDATFLFADHFYGSSLDLTKWDEINSPTITVIGSEVEVESTDGVWRGIFTDNTFGGPYDIAWRSRKRFTLSQYNIAGMANSSVAVHGLDDENMSFYWVTLDRETCKTAHNGAQQTTNITSDGANHIFDLEWVDGPTQVEVKFYIDGSLQATHATQVPDLAMMCYMACQNTSQFCDWVLVRKCVDPAPTHGTWGSEEEETVPVTTGSVPILESLGVF